jgi:hypothetical protein
LLLGPPPSQASLTNHLDEAIGQLGVELAAWWEVDTELEVLWTSAAWVWDLVLDNVNGSSFLAMSLSTVAELVEGWVDAMAANRICWGTQSALVATLLHFSKLEAELELLGSGRNPVPMKEQVDALLTLACPASDMLASYVLASVSCSPPDGPGSSSVGRLCY